MIKIVRRYTATQEAEFKQRHKEIAQEYKQLKNKGFELLGEYFPTQDGFKARAVNKDGSFYGLIKYKGEQDLNEQFNALKGE